ncbi:MAG: DUF4936 family protein [Rhodoferax sp.]|nr:DUF4936 family protein [Rhodoferax sp.]
MDRYIYYRAPADKADALRQQVLQMHGRIAAQTGVRCALKRQAQAHEGMHTWMEVYSGIPENFAEHLQELVAQTELLSFIVGIRHVDDFMDCDELE